MNIDDRQRNLTLPISTYSKFDEFCERHGFSKLHAANAAIESYMILYDKNKNLPIRWETLQIPKTKSQTL